MLDDSPFRHNVKSISAALAICERIFYGSMGDTIEPAQSRVAVNPVDVIADFADVLRVCRDQLAQAQREDTVEL